MTGSKVVRLDSSVYRDAELLKMRCQSAHERACRDNPGFVGKRNISMSDAIGVAIRDWLAKDRVLSGDDVLPHG